MNARQRWLAIALAVTVVAAFWPQHENDLDDLNIVAPSRPAASAQSAAAPSKAVVPDVQDSFAGGQERFAGKAEGNLFPQQTWVPPPPTPTKIKPLPPPPPTPPALPFSYLGRWTERGSETIFLAQGERVLQARQGDVLAINWRLDEVTPSQLVFTYLPMDMTQTMRISP